MNRVDGEEGAVSLRAALEEEAGRADSLFVDLPARYGFYAVGHEPLVVSVEAHRPRVEQGEGSPRAECILVADEGLLVDVLKGREHLGGALLEGRVDVRGDLSLVARLHSALRAAVDRRTRAT